MHYMKKILITTGDIEQKYQLLGPVFYHISNKGLFSNQLAKLIKKHNEDIQKFNSQGGSFYDSDWSIVYGSHYLQNNDEQEAAFIISLRELSSKAENLGADAVINMRCDIKFEVSGFQGFSLHIFGTAVKFQ